MGESITMSDGYPVPLMGLGTWLSAKGKAGEAVKYALELGYRHIDCARAYQNEAEIGEYMEPVFKDGTVKREDVFVTSKLWCKDFAPKDVIPACEGTLKDLRLEYLDLYLAHLPFRLEQTEAIGVPEPQTGKGLIGYSVELMKETWQEMEKLVERGLCRSIGVSNFTVKKLKEMKQYAKIKPVCNQVELHPYLPQHALQEYCKKEGIALVAYSPLGNPGRPSIFTHANDPVLLEDQTTVEIAKKHKCTVAQVLIKWLIQHKVPAIPKSVTPSRIVENFESLKVNLDDSDMAKLDAIKTRHRYVTQCWAQFPNQTMDELWDNENLL